MHERKQIMVTEADGFIALPGGFGTLDELFEVLAWSQLAIHDRPAGVLQVDGFFDGIPATLALWQRVNSCAGRTVAG